MKRTTVLLGFITAFFLCEESMAERRNIGIFKDNRSYGVEGVVKTLEEEGFSAGVLESRDLIDVARLAEFDAIYLPGGWSAIDFAGFRGRKNLTDYVACGKGILAGAFRSGWFRTENRPLFPDVGYSWFISDGVLIMPDGGSELAKAFDGPYTVANWDHMLVRAGSRGNVFAVDSGGNSVGVYGDIYGGRYIAFGDFIHMKKDKMVDGTRKRVFLECLRWLLDVPKGSEKNIEENRQIAEEDFLRREFMYDWLLDEPGPDNGPGVIPEAMYQVLFPMDLVKCRLEYARKNSDGKYETEISDVISRANAMMDAVKRRADEISREKALEIGAMSLEELRNEHPLLSSQVFVERVGALSNDVLRNQLLSGFERKTVEAKSVHRALCEDGLKRKMLSDEEFTGLKDDADSLLRKVQPEIATLRRRQWAEEQSDDIKMIPGLSKQLLSSDCGIRLRAVRELGRIGDTKTSSFLIDVLDDDDIEVRTAAIQALGWMQAGEAVPGLIKLLSSNEVRTRRRVAQALGQIGDDRATRALLNLMDDSDHHVRQNAIFALGWLKSKEAVPTLMKIVQEGDSEDPYQRDLMITAIRSLGHTGDRRALPLLKDLAANANDFPGKARYREGRHVNIYAIGSTLGLQGHAELALKEIESGGMEGKGIVQLPGLNRRDKFHAVRDNFNFFVGRLFCSKPEYRKYFLDDPDSAFALVRSLGGTGVNCGWDITRESIEPEDYLKILQKADLYDLKWIDTMPSVENGIWHVDQYKKYKRNGSLLCKPTAEFILGAYGDVPAFQGFWYEEKWPEILMTDPKVQNAFCDYVRGKNGDDYLAKTGWNPDDDGANMWRDLSPEGRRVWADFLTIAGDMLIDEWRESQEWLHGLRKGCSLTFNESEGELFRYVGDYGRAGAVIDGFGPESYLSFDPNSTLMMELAKDGTSRPVMSEFYNVYDPSLRHSRLGFARHLMHGECFFIWELAEIMDYPMIHGMFWWKKGIQEHVERTFLDAQKVKQYLCGAQSAANVALIASERSQLLFYSRAGGETHALSRRYYQHLTAMWEMLRQAGVSADAIWAETLTAEKAARYKVFILSDAKSLTSGEMEVLRDWVNAGGVLIATGSSSLFDEYGTQMEDYLMGDVFGLKYSGHGAVSNPDLVDTWCFVEKEGVFKVVDEGFDRDRILRHVVRERKPEESVKMYATLQDTILLPGIPGGFACEYDLPLGVDKATPSGASVLAEWSEGTSALTVNEFGKGLCYFWTPVYPGLCHTVGDIVYSPCEYKFWPGIGNLLRGMIDGGLRHQASSLPVEVISGPREDVEVVVRAQPEQSRWIIHLLNCNTDLETVKGLNLLVHPPQEGISKIFYPVDGEETGFVKSAGGVALTVRDFEVHAMIVVEY